MTGMHVTEESAVEAIAESRRAMREYWRQVDIGGYLAERIDRLFTQTDRTDGANAHDKKHA